MTAPDVVHVIAPAPIGGAERVVRDLAVGQAAAGLAPKVALLLDEGGPESWLMGELERSNVPTMRIVSPPRHYHSTVRKLRRHLQESKPKVVHTHADRADVLTRIAATGLGIPLVATVHGFPAGDLKRRFYYWLDQKALQHFDAVIAVSADLEQLLLEAGVRRSRVHRIGNGLLPLDAIPRDQARSTLGVDPDIPLVGWIGRLSPEKGADVFIEAIAGLENSSTVGVVIGDGEIRSTLEALASQAGVNARIRFAGSVPDAGTLLSGFDVFVISSHSEGYPIGLLEALVSGVPTVATAVGEIPAITQQGKSAHLVEPGDPSALAAAIGSVLANLTAETGRAQAGKGQALEEFGMERWVARVDAVYAAVTP